MADELKPKLELSKQLVMTPQLQLAIRLLGTPSAGLATLIAPIAGVEAAGDHDPDLLQEPGGEELALQEETGVSPWRFQLDRPTELTDAADTDVWIIGNPPLAVARRAASPHLRIRAAADADQVREARWLLRALRQRAKTYERVTAALVELRPQLAVAIEPTIEPVPMRAIAERIGMHESTVTRVVGVIRIQNRHRVWSLATTKRGITLA